ncbi:MAG: hypothetical protein U0V56_13410 [Actinomycetota bacterium]
MLLGGQDVAAAASAVVAGGHVARDGAGLRDGRRGVRRRGPAAPQRTTGRPGQALFLTKPMGVGMIATAIERGRATPEQAEAAVRTAAT